MINSMTGFGLSSFIDKKSEIYIEIKGVNHKFLEISIKPNDLNNELEEYIRKLVSKKTVRGRVDIRMKIKTTSNTSFTIDTKLLKDLKSHLKRAFNMMEIFILETLKMCPVYLNQKQLKI